MSPPCFFADSLPAEHRVLCREYAAVQERCSQLIARQQAHIERLQSEVIRLRAAVIVRDTALAIERTPAQGTDAPAPSGVRERRRRLVPLQWLLQWARPLA